MKIDVYGWIVYSLLDTTLILKWHPCSLKSKAKLEVQSFVTVHKYLDPHLVTMLLIIGN